VDLWWTPRPLHKAAVRPKNPCKFQEADARTRTGDPFITSEVLYQLSYVGEDAECSAAPMANLGSEPVRNDVVVAGEAKLVRVAVLVRAGRKIHERRLAHADVLDGMPHTGRNR
jgi:hypothetical protein